MASQGCARLCTVEDRLDDVQAQFSKLWWEKESRLKVLRVVVCFLFLEGHNFLRWFAWLMQKQVTGTGILEGHGSSVEVAVL